MCSAANRFLRLCALSVFSVLILSAAPVLAQQASAPAGTSTPLAVGAPFPNLTLPGDVSQPQLDYLGAGKSGGGVEVNDISAKAVILVVFSMYCPHCQREAPVLNELYNLIASQGLAQSVKLVGLGAGNSRHEVSIFRNKYEVAFPLFVDPDFAAHTKLGGVGTPYFYVLAKDGSGYKVALSRLGRISSPQDFLNEVRQAAKI